MSRPTPVDPTNPPRAHRRSHRLAAGLAAAAVVGQSLGGGLLGAGSAPVAQAEPLGKTSSLKAVPLKVTAVAESANPPLPENAIANPGKRQVAAADDLMIAKVRSDGTVSDRWARPSSDLTTFTEQGVEAAEDGRPLARTFYGTAAARPLDQSVERTLSFRMVRAGRANLWQLGSTDATAEQPGGLTENAGPVSGHTYVLSLPAAKKGGTLSADSKAAPGAAGAVGTSPDFSTGPREQWTVLDAGSGWVRLVNKSDGLCLANGPGAGQPATTSPCQGNDAGAPRNLWQLGKQDTNGFGGFNGYRLINKQSGLAVASGANEANYGDTPDANQTWQLTEVRETGGTVPTWTVPAGSDVAAGAGLATGDLDSAVGEDSQFHDEAAVAFVEDDHQVQIRVIDYADNRLLESGVTLDVQAGGVVQGAWRTGSLNVAVGDFAGDGGNEIAVTRQNARGEILADILRYTAKGDARALETVAAGQKLVGAVPGAGGDIIPSLVTGMVSTAAGDFDGSGRAGLALAYGAGSTPVPDHVRLSVVSFNSQGQPAGLRTETSTLSAADNGNPPTLPDLLDGPWISRGPEVAAGLFKYDPDSGYGLFRRQLAVTWSATKGLAVPEVKTYLGTFTVNGRGGTITGLHQPVLTSDTEDQVAGHVFTATAGRFPLALAVGGLRGVPTGKDPVLDGVAVADTGLSLDKGEWAAHLRLFDISADGIRLRYHESTAAPIDQPWSYRPTTYDRTGRTLHLGAPLVVTLNRLQKPTTIAAQPPTHLDWLDDTFVNVSRTPEFAVSMTSSSGTETTTTRTHKTSTTLGVSAGLDVKDTLTAGLPEEGEGVALSAQVKDKLNNEWENEQTDFEGHTTSTTTKTTATGGDDDMIESSLTTYRLFRYPILGPSVVSRDGKDDPDSRGVYEVAIAGTPVTASVPGRNVEEYQPSWQNGNALSYPRLNTDGQVLVSDAGEYIYGTGGSATVSSKPFINKNYVLGGFAQKTELEIEKIDKTSNETASAANFSNSLEVGVGVRAVASFPGVLEEDFEAEATVGFDAKSAESVLDESETATSLGSGFALDVPQIDANKSYGVGTTYYTDAAGMAKVRHGVNLQVPGQTWWRSTYSKAQDLALNLPYATLMKQSELETRTEPKWNDGSERQKIRGFYALQPQDPASPATSGVPYVDNSMTAGDPVNFAVQVHNYSLVASAPATARFYAVRVDELGLDVESEPLPIGTAPVPGLDAQGMTTVTAPQWKAEGADDGTDLQKWRIFTVIDTGDRTETHSLRGGKPCPAEKIDGEGGSDGGLADPMTGEPETLTCGQNNQGFGEITVTSPTPRAEPAQVDLDGASLATENELAVGRGVPTVVLGEQVKVVVHASSDRTTDGSHHVMVSDGDPDHGGQTIAVSRMTGVDATTGGHTDFTWTPTKAGRHTLYQQLLRADGTVDQQKFVIKVLDHGDPERLVIKMKPAMTTAGKAAAFTATRADVYGNEVDDVSAKTAFSISPTGTCKAVRCTATKAGMYTVTGRYRSLSDTATMRVKPGAAANLRISPARTTVARGKKVTYHVKAYDRYGNLRGEVTTKAKFTIKPNGSCRRATCWATRPGKHSVAVAYSKLTRKATLTVRR